ncbi:hypothetical protein FRZ67_13720 [Panacibacter ginsenosidivorans]|uniref:Uncharacterized protein n=1 Tax=Panacibacter ginsenosidivorans TaxID=1813871 RepID=A0A5B8VCA3_9BACT|nr:hypothetical protein [Panacibacter ginsenosidivorans]QEC68306.1 hypothetical protein FRZ67_13720 [Panacibacter ginsenosidivorans]
MKALTFFLFIFLFSIAVVTGHAQSSKYLLMEFIKMKPGVTDTSAVMKYARERVNIQEQKFKSVVWSSVWQVANPAHNKNQYDYITATVFRNFNDWLAEYKNSDSKGVFYSLTKGRMDSASIHKSDSFDIIYTPISEVVTEAGALNKQPQLLLVKYVKATPGKERPYEQLETADWLPIHQDLIKKKFETAHNFNRLIYPEAGSDYNYSNFTFFADEAMFDKQDDIDFDPYMRSNQSAFINAATLNKEVFAELLKLVAVVKIDE